MPPAAGIYPKQEANAANGGKLPHRGANAANGGKLPQDWQIPIKSWQKQSPLPRTGSGYPRDRRQAKYIPQLSHTEICASENYPWDSLSTIPKRETRCTTYSTGLPATNRHGGGLGVLSAIAGSLRPLPMRSVAD